MVERKIETEEWCWWVITVSSSRIRFKAEFSHHGTWNLSLRAMLGFQSIILVVHSLAVACLDNLWMQRIHFTTHNTFPFATTFNELYSTSAFIVTQWIAQSCVHMAFQLDTHISLYNYIVYHHFSLFETNFRYKSETTLLTWQHFNSIE